MSGIKNRLRELRKERGLSQQKVALDLHLNQNSISRYETGKRDLGQETLIRFANYYDVSVDYILYRSNTK